MLPAHFLSRIPLTVLVAAGLVLLGCTEDRATEPSVTGLSLAKGGGSGPSVDEADPPDAPQDTTLDVLIFGSGFDDGSVAEFAIDGVPAPKVHVNGTQYLNSSELRANVTIDPEADTTLYDVAVTTARGKKGVGADLFRVRKHGGNPDETADPEIAFTSGGDLIVMNADGARQTLLIPTPAATPSWAGDGDGSLSSPYRIVYVASVSGCASAILQLDTVGGSPRVVANDPLDVVNSEGTDLWTCAPQWSPVADEIAFAGYRDDDQGPDGLYLVAAAGGQAELLYDPGPRRTVFWSAWSPDGTAIAFEERSWDNCQVVGTMGCSWIRILNRVTGDVTTVIDSSEFRGVNALDWSPAGDELVVEVNRFVRMRGKNVESVEELTRFPLVKDGNGNYIRGSGAPVVVASDQYRPSWSPDGLKIAANGVVVIDVLTGQSQSLASGIFPDWRR